MHVKDFALIRGAMGVVVYQYPKCPLKIRANCQIWKNKVCVIPIKAQFWLPAEYRILDLKYSCIPKT